MHKTGYITNAQHKQTIAHKFTVSYQIWLKLNHKSLPSTSDSVIIKIESVEFWWRARISQGTRKVASQCSYTLLSTKICMQLYMFFLSMLKVWVYFSDIGNTSYRWYVEAVSYTFINTNKHRVTHVFSVCCCSKAICQKFNVQYAKWRPRPMNTSTIKLEFWK